MQETRPEIGKHVIDAIKEQIRTNNPPETTATFERLIAEGHPESEVYTMLACVLSAEIFAVMKEQRPYNHDLYVKNLQRLPILPWE